MSCFPCLPFILVIEMWLCVWNRLVACLSKPVIPRFWLFRSSWHSCARAGFTNFAPPFERPFSRSSRIRQLSVYFRCSEYAWYVHSTLAHQLSHSSGTLCLTLKRIACISIWKDDILNHFLFSLSLKLSKKLVLELLSLHFTFSLWFHLDPLGFPP